MPSLDLEAIRERKVRERLAFLALPPAEAQSLIALPSGDQFRIVTPSEPDFCSCLAEDPSSDAALDE